MISRTQINNKRINRAATVPQSMAQAEAPAPRLTVTLEASRAGELRVGESLIFTVLVRNEGGGTAQDVVISCGLDCSVLKPEMVSWNGAEMSCWAGCISVGPLCAGDIAALAISARAVRAGTVRSRAEADSAETAPVSSVELTTVVRD